MVELLAPIISSATSIYELAKTINNSKLMVEIANLQMQVANLQISYAALQKENLDLKSQRQEDIDNPLSINADGVYFDSSKSAYCTGCYDGITKRRIHLTYCGDSGYASPIYRCPVCEATYPT